MSKLFFLSLLFFLVLTTEAVETIETIETIDTEEVIQDTHHYDQLQPVELTLEQRILNDQHSQAQQISVNYDHIQTYSVSLKPHMHQQFTFKVAENHHIKGHLDAYLNQDGMYSETTYVKGEEIYLQVFQDGVRLLVQKQCYHTMGFEFEAKKGHKYHLKFITAGSQKALVFVLENFVSQGHVQEVLKAEHVGEHANRTKIIKEHLAGYLSVIERHSLFTDKIAHQVSSQTSKFLAYQWFEMFIVFGAAVGQVYFLRKMFNTNSII